MQGHTETVITLNRSQAKLTRQKVEERQFNRHAATDGETEVPESRKGAAVQLIARPGTLIPLLAS